MSISEVLKSKAVRWTVLSVAGLVALVLVALSVASEWMFNQPYDVPTIVLRSQVPPSAERGARLSIVFGCQGCHGSHGRVLFEAPFFATVVTPDLARVAQRLSDQELAVAIRAGIKPDHTSTMIMPAGSFSSMSDGDLADIIAWLRSLTPDAETETRLTSFGPMGRVLALQGALPMSAAMPHDPAPPVDQPTEPIARGGYFVKVACTHCHELERAREVEPGVTAPALRPMAQAYDAAQFVHLLRDGKGVGERELGLMSNAARGAFSHFDDAEIAAIHEYLLSLGNGPEAED